MTRLGGMDRTFFFLLLGVVAFGFFMLISASAPSGFERFGDSYYYVKHQLFVGLLPGIALFTIALFTPTTLLQRYAGAMLLFSIGLLLLVFIPGIGQDFGTFANSWVQIGSFSFQPAEIVKLSFLIYISAWLEKQKAHLHDFQTGLLPFVAVLGVIAGLIMLQPDLGTLAIIVLMSFVVYFVAGGHVVHLSGLGIAGILVLIIMIQASPYRLERFTTFLHPEVDPQGVGYQVNQALLGIGSGGIIGRGYGHSLQKFQYLPEVIGDSIFAVIAEEFGFIFTTAFIFLYACLILRGIKIAQAHPEGFSRYFIIGVMAWIGIQALVNIGAMLSILPLTGVTLPFVSYGGTSLIVSLTAMGIVLQMSREVEL